MRISTIRLTIAMTFILTEFVAGAHAAQLPSPLSAGPVLWATQRVSVTPVAPDGARASVNLGPARTAALGHLDSDGVIDLIVAHEAEGGAVIMVSPGDIRFRRGPRYDLERERLGLPPERPFLDVATVYQLPFVPDWMAVGDWDADGDFDVVFAARDRSRLFWMEGDGEGHLDEGGFVALDGPVTAFSSGDVNRRDGLADLVIATAGPAGPALLVFESPEGALRRPPEKLEMPARVSSLAIDGLDEEICKDIAAAAGETVVVVRGRDRKLALRRELREAVGPATRTEIAFEGKVIDLVTGDFSGHGRRAQLAVRLEGGDLRLVRRAGDAFAVERLGTLPGDGRLTAARVSGLPGHDLLVVRPSWGTLDIFHVDPAKNSGNRLAVVPAPDPAVSGVIAGRLDLDTRDDLILLGDDGEVHVAAGRQSYWINVDAPGDTDNGACITGNCTLRDAINYANSLDAGSSITFDSDVFGLGATITVSSELPTLTQPVATVIDGTVGSGFFTGPLTLDGSGISGEADGLAISGGNATITNLSIINFPGTGANQTAGIHLTTGGGNIVTSCRIGIGSVGAAPNYNGISIYSSANNLIGGAAAGEGNTISGNERQGILIRAAGGTNNRIFGNLIGLDIGGSFATPNGEAGISLESGADGWIGTTVSGGGNTISGNSERGIDIAGTTANPVAGWTIQGNLVGLDAAGETAVPNAWVGIEVTQTRFLTIGGTTASARNVISATDNGSFEQSRAGIQVGQGSLYSQIMGNYIGTDAAGASAVGNLVGIGLADTEQLTIGGSVAGAKNLISGNRGVGIGTDGLSPYNSSVDILGNDIGPSADGGSLGNSSGISLADGQYYTIGTIDAPNTIAFNTLSGIKIRNNCIRAAIGPNSIHDNGYLGIDLGGDGVTANDDLDTDTGPNNLQNFPVIEFVDAATGDLDFWLDSAGSTTYTLHFYESPSCDASGYGQGATYLGSATVTTEAGGSVSDQVTLGQLTPGASITATAMDPSWNTSEFSQCYAIPVGPDFIFSDGFESGTTTAWTAKSTRKTEQ